MPLSKQTSADDLIELLNVHVELASRRARSASPTKMGPPPLRPGFEKMYSSDDLVSVLSGASSTSGMTSRQLRELSRSPLLKNLHITRSSYAIPIPFTLQLPPRLSNSAPTTPKNKASFRDLPKSPSRLIFTGKSYEALQSDSDSDRSFGERMDHFSPGSAKPPAVTTSRKKVAKFVRKTNSVPADQLSMIEEASRANSMHSKALPLIPRAPEHHNSDGTVLAPVAIRVPSLTHEPGILDAGLYKNLHESTIDMSRQQEGMGLFHHTDMAQRTEPRPAQIPPSVSSSSVSSKKMTRKAPPDMFPNNSAHTSGQAVVQHPAPNLGPGRAEISMTHRTGPARAGYNIPPSSMENHGAQTEVLAPVLLNTLRHSVAFHHNLNDAELRIDKRTFSDESQVSSVSSFSSVGDYFNVNPYAYSTRDLKIPPRGPLHQLRESNSPFLDVEIPAKSAEADFPDTVLSSGTADDTLDVDTLPLNSEPADEAEDSNRGAGFGFSFPNNESNVTNTKKPKAARPVHSTYASISTAGQIEIPDLAAMARPETAPLHSAASLPTSTSMEPIGMPSTAAKSHFKSMFDGIGSDSDSESSFNSQFSKLNNDKQAEEKEATQLKPTARNLPLSSPVRHVRGRSMYNIDFDGLPEASPERKHSRSKSADMLVTRTRPLSTRKYAAIRKSQTEKFLIYLGQGIQGKPGNLEEEQQALSPAKLPAKTLSQRASRSPNKPAYSPTASDSTVCPQVIVAPPKKVQYAVDFRAPSRLAERADSFSIKRPGSTYDCTKPGSLCPESAYRSTPTSETASSYQSSRTARETASTAPTDTNSVVIDLTKDGYNLCMIQRNDSQTSYRSVIEKTKDGKDVEVVLVDEDDDNNNNNNNNISKDLERDDLLSIYSRYMGDWVARSDSVRSAASDSSTATSSSWANSEANFHVKSMASLRREQAYKTGPSPVKMRSPQKTGKFLSIREENARPEGGESHYYDYSAGDNYDFKTFMNQRKSAGIK